MAIFFLLAKTAVQYQTFAINHLDMMSEVDEILNNITSNKQFQRRIWEWMELQVNDGGEQESESQMGGSGKDPPHSD